MASHHFAAPARFAHEASNVLKPAGRLVMIDSIGDNDPELDELLDQLERRRDPTHARSLTLPAWKQMLAEAGLTVDHVETFQRTHIWDDWTGRSGMTPASRAALEEFLRSAPRRFRERYVVQFLPDGTVHSWSDFKCLIRGVK